MLETMVTAGEGGEWFPSTMLKGPGLVVLVHPPRHSAAQF